LNACGSTPVRVATLRFAENFPTAFKTRTSAAFINSETSPPPAVQNSPGGTWNTTTGFYNPALVGANGNLALAGLADAGTRLRAWITNIPAGAAVYVSTGRVQFSGGVPSAAATTPVARLIQNEVGAFAPLAASATLDSIPAAQLQVVNGTATAVW